MTVMQTWRELSITISMDEASRSSSIRNYVLGCEFNTAKLQICQMAHAPGVTSTWRSHLTHSVFYRSPAD